MSINENKHYGLYIHYTYEYYKYKLISVLYCQCPFFYLWKAMNCSKSTLVLYLWSTWGTIVPNEFLPTIKTYN